MSCASAPRVPDLMPRTLMSRLTSRYCAYVWPWRLMHAFMHGGRRMRKNTYMPLRMEGGAYIYAWRPTHA
eukprot:350928-Chlamydomonas_euryale.AAC.7